LARQREEYTDWRKEHLDLIASAVSRAEVKTLYTLMGRKMQRHNDTSGLRILEEHRQARLLYIDENKEAEK
jgi:hypothetical protein